jgi:predicted amidohydrolase
MIVGLLQFAPARLDTEANVSFVEAGLRGCGADLVVLPELALTGYLFSSRTVLEKHAEEIPGPSTERLERICRKENLTIVCGMAEKSGGAIYNSAAVVGPGGHLGTYRKIHLFSEEKDIFDPGRGAPLLLTVTGARVGILICFDWIFPEAARTLAIAGADIIAHCSNLVLRYAQNAAVTRCIENRLFWILANRTGEEIEGDLRYRFTGRSRIVSPLGEVLTQCDGEVPCLAVAEINPEAARDKRVTPRNDLLMDRRPDLYRL